MNAQLDNILTQIDESTGSPADIHKLVAEAKLIIKKRQKLIKIADKAEMVGSLSKSMRPMISPQILKMRRRFAKLKLPLRRREKKRRVTSVTLRKNFKSSSDFQLFRGKTTIYFYFVKFSGFLVGLPEHPTINLLYQVILRGK